MALISPTFTEVALTPLTYSVTDGYMTVFSVDNLLDGLQFNVNVVIESNISPVNTWSGTFTFVVTFELLLCTPDLQLSAGTMVARYELPIGTGDHIWLDGYSNNDCEFTVRV